MPVNRKRIHRLMKIDHLLVPKNLKLRAPRKAATHKPRTVEPDWYWGIDMTKVMIATFGWVYLHVVIDWGSKKLLSTHVSLTNKSSDWLGALNEAVNLQFPNGIKEAANIPELISDHGSQPTSPAFSKSLFGARYSSNIRQLLQSKRQPGYGAGDSNHQGGLGLDQRI